MWTAVLSTVIAMVLVLPSGAALGSTAILYFQATRGLPEPRETVSTDAVIGATKLYDSTGETLLYSVEDPLGDQRQWVTLDSLPQHVIDATLVWEDPNFMNEARFDAFSTSLRLWNSVFSGKSDPDPTLTGRLVRNTILSPSEPDATREIALVAEIDRLYTPDQILEWHLNTNYYGNDAYGIDAAARVYLGKPAADLTLDETALLAAIPLAPQYNPFDNEAAARGRQQDVLRAMLRASKITQPAFDEAANALTPLQEGEGYAPEVAPDFSVFAREQAEDILDSMGLDGSRLVARGGLRITTTLDMDLYYQTQCALATHLARLNAQPPPSATLDGQSCSSAAFLPSVPPGGGAAPNNGAVVIIDVSTGEIRAVVGSALPRDNQPGPILQPFVYFTGFTTALFNPATMVQDIPKPFPGAQEGLIYTPTNPDNRFRGPMNLRDAMGVGLLPPAADVAYRQGIDTILRTAHQIGLDSLDLGAYDLTLLERGGGVSLLDVSYAYSVFASLGNMRGVSVQPVANGYRGRDPVAVRRIEDANGGVLWEYNASQIGLNSTNILQPELGYLVNDILADQETRWPVLGENNVLDLPRTAAVVNGITSDRADDWTVGYTPQLVVGVHLNRDENGSRQPMTLDPFGLTGAASVWRAVTEYAHERDGLQPQSWQRPPSIVEQAVCERSGTLPNGNCPVRGEIFLDGTQTRLQTDTFWQSFQINSQTGQLATANTPGELRRDQVYFVPPPEAIDWWQANNLPLPPTEYDTVSRPELFGTAAILQPEPFAYVGGQVDVRGSIIPDHLQFYQLAYGQGLNPSQWTDIGGPQTTFTRGDSLATWDTTGLDGLYNLRLTVVTDDNSIETRVTQVTVDNLAPTLSLSAGESGKIFRWPGDTVIPLTADVLDNLAIAHVEFYHNGQYVGRDEEWPYGFEWETTGVGTESFSATAFDAVGNSSSADLTVEVVRAG
jgi:membrane peptidoglycan carboxypeptidase